MELVADTGIFATTAEVSRRAGAQASTVSNTEAYINDFMTCAESYINDVCKYNFSDNYATLNVDVKNILKRWACALAAADVILYDTSRYYSRQVEMMLDYLNNIAQECERQMKEKDKVEFVNRS